MTAVLLDTHAWAWSLTGDMRLSTKATALITEADSVFVSPISFFEIGQKVRIGKWPEMEPFINDLPSLLAEQGGRVAALAPEVCLKGATLAWEHRDPFDRLLAATTLALGIPLISADEVFDTLPDISRLW
ncbi:MULTISPECIES: type II toxin-antitoxin system VapC family toxin [Sinorhizobium/Ensifer group]|uniref:type II toxin-antitoxin system VapC family toxin n=1 Tax=Sinorhizobium/Ensifer group TaxID=227292 RepID=UPI00071CB19C|nr:MULTISPECIES: type II toxin-antitoxin system VapC family toxin [Sinorhizobium/Ensifer group]KSV64949.1 twitching motility protein PilT [Sinorhizobium sp. Sb3]KSV89460.1 twitching motility protein PilT [Sinorhizobium sp. GL28]WDZ80846.1 type II toxin-antitoxin system VapC family toxin [Ensifer adhaerens]